MYYNEKMKRTHSKRKTWQYFIQLKRIQKEIQEKVEKVLNRNCYNSKMI